MKAFMEADILLRASASSPVSSLFFTTTTVSRSPLSIALAFSLNLRMGITMEFLT